MAACCKFQFQVAELVIKGNNKKKFVCWKAGSPGHTDKWSVTLSLPLHLQGSELDAAFRLLPVQTFPQIKGGFHRCVLIRGKLWSGRASEGAHSPLASARRATPLRRFFRSHGFTLGFELRPRTELHMTATALYKNPSARSHTRRPLLSFFKQLTV